MKYNSYNLDFKVNSSFSSISELQILELQEVFLTNGFHYIAVPTIQEGRSLVYTFLEALRCFQTVGCITQNKIGLEQGVFDIVSYLDFCGFNDISNIAERELYFNEVFDFDFVWIESHNKDQWHLYFEQKIQELGIDQQIPVIVLSAEIK